MAEILRVKARWGGFNGSPGYSVFHMKDFEAGGSQEAFAQGGADRVRAFFESFKAWLAYGVNVQVLGEVEAIEETTGQLQEVYAVSQPGIVTSTASVVDRYAGAVGAVVTWRTGGIRNGRRIKGRTFLVPLTGNAYENNGSLHADSLGAINTAATALRDGAGSPDLGVYARPTGPGATDGIWHVVTSHSTPDMSAVLRSRRD
jgi:hypothetical protein